MRGGTARIEEEEEEDEEAAALVLMISVSPCVSSSFIVIVRPSTTAVCHPSGTNDAARFFLDDFGFFAAFDFPFFFFFFFDCLDFSDCA